MTAIIKRIKKMKEVHPLLVRFDVNTFKWLKRVAHLEETTMNRVIIDLVVNKIKHAKKELQRKDI